MVRFSWRMVPEVYQVFWAGMAGGEFITDAAAVAGTYRKQGTRWLFAAGGVRPRRGRDLKGRCLTLPQREEIALGRARGESIRVIAAGIGRSPSTVSRELRRNSDGSGGRRIEALESLSRMTLKGRLQTQMRRFAARWARAAYRPGSRLAGFRRAFLRLGRVALDDRVQDVVDLRQEVRVELDVGGGCVVFPPALALRLR